MFVPIYYVFQLLVSDSEAVGPLSLRSDVDANTPYPHNGLNPHVGLRPYKSEVLSTSDHGERSLQAQVSRSQEQLESVELPYPIPSHHRGRLSTFTQLQQQVQRKPITQQQRKQLENCNVDLANIHVTASTPQGTLHVTPSRPHPGPPGTLHVMSSRPHPGAGESDRVNGGGVARAREGVRGGTGKGRRGLESVRAPGTVPPSPTATQVATAIATDRPYLPQDPLKPVLEGKNVVFISSTGDGRSPVLAASICNDHLEKAGTKIAYICHKHEVKDQVHRMLVASLPKTRYKVNKHSKGSNQSLEGLIKSSDILVLTATILRKELEENNHVAVTDFSMVIFEQCHRAVKDHPFNKIMEEYTREEGRNPTAILPQVKL